MVSREWRNGVQLYLLLLPFFHSLLTEGRLCGSLEVWGDVGKGVALVLLGGLSLLGAYAGAVGFYLGFYKVAPGCLFQGIVVTLSLHVGVSIFEVLPSSSERLEL